MKDDYELDYFRAITNARLLNQPQDLFQDDYEEPPLNRLVREYARRMTNRSMITGEGVKTVDWKD